MDHSLLSPDAAPADVSAPPPQEPTPSLAPESSSSLLSDAPTTDAVDPTDTQAKPPGEDAPLSLPSDAPNISTLPQESAPNVDKDVANATASSTSGLAAATEQMTKDMSIAENISHQPPATVSTPATRGGRGGKRASFANVGATPNQVAGEAGQATPIRSGRGRGGGRPRGRGRGGGRGGKRKREDRSDGDSDDSEVYTSAATMTKSGRSIQKPTTFVPPPPSPTTATTTKRKRTYRRNPESAVCKLCLRGTSPASNMIVFCDGCNTPYHRYCHQPPIDQAVIDEVDKEWYCKPCERERIVPVPEADVSSFVSAEGAPAEQRQKYFASLPPGMLVTLLTRATSLRPDLPVFGPDFEARASTNAGAMPQAVSANGQDQSLLSNRTPSAAANTHLTPAGPQLQAFSKASTSGPKTYEEDPRYPVPEEHPAHYVRPGQGLMNNLPPEREDLQWLVDNEDGFGVFNHYVLNPQRANLGSGGGVGQARPGA